MKDIVSIGADIGLLDSQMPKAANILSIQLGSLEYAPSLGIDLKYFLSEDFRFQDASFRSYLVEVLADNNINVASVTEAINNLFSNYAFTLKAPEETNSGLVAR